MKNKIIVIFSSHYNAEENNKFISHIEKTIGTKHKTVCYENHNEFSLSELYNKAIDEHTEPNCIFVMCHNDIIFKTNNWGKLLLQKFNNSKFGIIGVAGTSYVPESGMWWEDRSKMYGIVEHTNGITEWASEFSTPINSIQEVAVIDGVFISFDPNMIESKFNTDYGKFHFYDLSFSLDNYLVGVNVGVITNIRILHKSVGQVNNSWEENRKKFISQYNLPIKHVSEQKLRVLICCQFFRNYTGSEVSNYELSKELVKLGCDVTIISGLVGEPLQSKAIKNGVKVYSVNNLPNYNLSVNGEFQFTKNEAEFDIIHINHKPIGGLMLKLYPNIPAVMHVRSEVIPVFEEPIIHPQIKKYISIRESITEYIKTFGINEDSIVTIDNPFDTARFNIKYKPVINKKEVVLFVGTLDYLRKGILVDLVDTTYNNNQDLWIIGEDSDNYATDLIQSGHVKFFGVKSNVEEFIKKCDMTAGIFKGRTTIEGYLCGKPGFIYTVDKEGNIITKEFTDVPADLSMYDSAFSAKKILNLYDEMLS
jgi:glycosyltransferase involved in cell wall biosynthesis